MTARAGSLLGASVRVARTPHSATRKLHSSAFAGAARPTWTAGRPQRPLRIPLRRLQSTAASKEPAAQGFWARSKDLAKRYGRIYTFTYLGLSAVDFSIVFAIILAGGGEYVRASEDWLLEHLDWRRAGEENPSKLKEKVGDWAQRHRHKPEDDVSLRDTDDEVASRKGQLGASLWTSAALAYGIHKILLLPVRLGATVALTPWIVRTLRARGWNVAPAAAAASTTATAAKNGVP